MKTHDRWLWIELIGFEVNDPDRGVERFLANAGFVPDAVLLLLFTPDFVHLHDGLGEERLLPPDHCSYSARPLGVERNRQEWTNHQLRELVAHLRGRGIAVYASFFNLFSSWIDGQPYQSPWCAAHPEVHETDLAGHSLGCLNPLRHLSDGTLYEDWFVDRLAVTLTDYGFDGWQAADGYSSPRLPIHRADYSADMVAQFADWLGRKVPADRIWAEARADWIRFYAARWEQFFAKATRTLHAAGKKLVLNSTWTRDPYQALYRYGVDYRKLAATGIDGFVVETVSAGVSLGAESGVETNAFYDYQAMLLTMKAAVPELPLHCLNGVHDTNEQWDLLRHGPTLAEREILTLAHLFHRRGGRWEHCSAGPVACLSDSVLPHEWEWLNRRWDLGFGADVLRPRGAMLLWSDAAFERQLEAYLADRRWTPHKWLYELLSVGAPVPCIARVEELGELDGALLVPCPELLPADELAAVLGYRGGPVVLIGALPDGLPAPDVLLRAGGIACALYGARANVAWDASRARCE
ncbi:MAG: hypothetical protein HYU66_11210 [Armatimonadetes bacterium]|nr:hypothetical protein [Armatimonadota bacterium]